MGLSDFSFYRRGPDHRRGVQVCFLQIQDEFGFLTMTVGKQISAKDYAFAANHIYDALSDLALMLGLPKKALGLNQTLRFAYGQGGRLGVQAHYNSQSHTLAIARVAGAGALAHEWWHGFDHYIAKRIFDDCPAHSFASKLWLSTQRMNPHPINLPLEAFFRHVLVSECGQNISPFMARAIKLDQAQNQLYFAKPEELTARFFESALQRHPEIKNQFLVQGTLQGQWAKLGAYPSQSEHERASMHLFNYFASLGQALKQQTRYRTS